MKLKLCRDRECEFYGIAIPVDRFSPNKQTKDHLALYCKGCQARRVAEYRERLAEIPRRARVRVPPSVAKYANR